MDMPQLSRIESHARVSAAARADEAQAPNGSRGFAALLVGEDAAGRRRRHTTPDSEPPPDENVAPDAPGDLDAAAELTLELDSSGDADEILPEDAHDPQELRALLATPPHD